MINLLQNHYWNLLSPSSWRQVDFAVEKEDMWGGFSVQSTCIGENYKNYRKQEAFQWKLWERKSDRHALDPASNDNCLPRTSRVLGHTAGSLEVSKPGSQLRGSDLLMENLIRAWLAAVRPHLSTLLAGACFSLCSNWHVDPTSRETSRQPTST